MHADGGTGILGALANASSLEETKATWVWFFALKKKENKGKPPCFFGAVLSAVNLEVDLNLPS